jgi:hypothetical protein
VSSCSQIFSAETLLRSAHEMAERFSVNANARELPLIHADPYLNNLLLKYCEAAITDRRGNVSQFTHESGRCCSQSGNKQADAGRRLSDEGLNLLKYFNNCGGRCVQSLYRHLLCYRVRRRVLRVAAPRIFATVCGMARLLSILTLWVPAYDIEGITKGFTALISVGITAALLLLMPRILVLPTRNQLQQAYAALGASHPVLRANI